MPKQQKKARKVGRPKLPRGEAKGRIVPVRFAADDLKAVAAAAKANKQTVSEWTRSTLGNEIRRQAMDTWTVRRNGKAVTFTYREILPNRAAMTAQMEGDEFKQLLEKTGLTLPLSHDDVERQFARIVA